MYVITRLLHLTITCATEAKVRLRASPTFALRSFYSANPFIISYNYPKALTRGKAKLVFLKFLYKLLQYII